MIELQKNKSYRLVQEINKGWSSDKKYYIETIDNQKLLMRIADINQYESKCREFEMMQSVFDLNIPMSKPLEIKISEDKKHVHSLFSWVEGEDAEQAIVLLSEAQQYKLGYEAGEILNKIHTINAPRDIENWESYYGNKIDKKIEMYNDCAIKIPNGHKIMDYINDNRHLIKRRGSSFHHGDFHLGNMILSDNKLSIIDFNRWDFGDSLEEFNRITFSAMVSPAFAAGQVDGYFNNNIPDDFFQLMTLYICVNTISSVSWAIPFGEKDMKVMLDMANKIMVWHDDMDKCVPNWYKSY